MERAMRKLQFLVSTLVLILSSPNFGFAQPRPPLEPQPRTIQVSGEGEVRVTPDEAIIAMSVESRNKDLLAGKKKVDASVKAVLELCNKMGIKPEDVQTDFVEVNPVFQNCSSTDRKSGICDPTNPDYFDVQKGILVRLKDLTKFEALVSESLQNGVSSVEDVQFITTQLRKLRDQARDMAVKAAKEKAEAVAGALEQKIGKPSTISVNGNWGYAGYYGNRGHERGYNAMSQNVIASWGGGGESNTGNSESAATSLGQIKVDAEVSVTFELE